ncbi:Dol-P-Man:Man(5)GlcNAc(2)-PP-Dol alpha-1,3-mannosyltransferase [Cyphellophora attinorum]|uniref:Dol-P-Man:Man(5)GlcNAc(2)-PP-Dol alpha-1,3-mannosyltransferase n=1 Tax=Cyphellophora attinorum TaxID=1664694 RepID=A0A0N1HR47_9EURO|nr:Dol-P-Man:Man(5)GlcNAc(2)-PP-Dol alpha-1,3-mannosyltransferase [Phialophora attinorum]KPI38145.1 Dol-P-Man:Man(5)GlcNAc(2)-PP-Dol alpha-1,3-mannosyltransferase [Phialophora attinorum]
MAPSYLNPHRLAPLTNPSYNIYLVPALLIFEAAFLSAIILKVPYTEIDWATYMVQVRKFLVDGERNYAKIDGPSGPCVYPAVFLYLYSALYSVTDQGQDIRTGQWIFAGVYLCVLATTMMCYWKVGAPPWLMVLLVGSKRLHSLFVLRLFNDCWAVACFWATVWLLQRRKWEAGALVWGAGVGIKMVLLLVAPALAFILVQGGGFFVGLFGGAAAVMLQVMTAVPFLDPKDGDAKMYFTRAFEFGRQFLYKWTVNWRFVSEETFLSKGFQVGLLILHVSILLVFIYAKWMTPSRLSSVPQFLRKFAVQEKGAADEDVSARVTPTFVMDAMLGSMAVGLLCARSLHYQFYAYLGWASPYLLWRSGGGVWWVLINWAVQEYAWLIFPQTELGSMLVVFELAIQVLSGLIAPPTDHIRPPTGPARRSKPKVG